MSTMAGVGFQWCVKFTMIGVQYNTMIGAYLQCQGPVTRSHVYNGEGMFTMVGLWYNCGACLQWEWHIYTGRRHIYNGEGHVTMKDHVYNGEVKVTMIGVCLQ